MKHLKTIFACLLMAVLSIGQVWADDPAAAGTTLFSEDFSGYAKDAVPSGSVATATGRVVYGGGSVTYTCTASGTKIYNENTGGGTAPEILVAKNGGTFVIAGIPSGDAQAITVSWTQNKQSLDVAPTGTGYSGSVSGKPANAGTRSFDITVADGADATFTLTFTGSGTSNVRVDDILVTVKTAGEGGAPAKTLSSVAVSGTPTKTSYYAGDNFDPAGLTVTGTYSDASTAPITSGITWTYNPAQTLVKDQTSIGVIATVSEITSAEYQVSITVTEAPAAVNYEKVTSEPADWSGEYILVYEADATNARVWKGADQANNYAEATIADGVIAAPEGAAVLNIAKVAESDPVVYTIMLGEKYIGQTSNANGIKIQDDAINNSISYNGTDAAVDIVASSAHLRYNSASSSYFRYYKSSSYSSQKKIQLYKKVGGSVKPAAGLAFETSAYLVKANGSLATPTLSTADGFDGTVTYASSDEAVVKVNASTGAITEIVAAGKAVITASSGETENFKAGSASYTIFVAEQAGTAEDPLTETSAKALIDLGCTLSAYVKGTVANVGDLNPTYGSITLTLTDGLKFFGMLNIDGEQFTSNPFVVGDVVTAVGNLKKYNSTYELDTNCELVERIPAAVVLESIFINGTATALEYTDGQHFDPAGLGVVGHYSDDSEAEITEGIVWAFDPDPLTEGTESVSVTATAGGFTSAAFVVDGLTVAGAAPLSPWASVYTSNVTLSTEGGTSASAAKVKFYGEEGDGYDAIKAGTGSVQGAVVVNVPAGATALHLHAYGWKGEALTLSITAPTGVTVTPSSITLNSNDGITSNSPFTLTEGSTPQTDAYYALTLSGNTAAADLTFTATSGKRFVLFGVNQEGALTLESISVSGTATELEYNEGDHFDPTGLVVTGHYSDDSEATISEGIDWTFDPDPLTEGTTSVSVTATASGKTSAAFVVDGLTVAGAAPLSPWASVYTSNVTLSTEGGTSASAAKVKFYGEEGDGYDAIKAGTGSVQGAVVVNVPAGATALHLHAYGWKGEALTLSITAPTGVTVTPSSITLNSNDGITSNSPFTLAEGSDPKTDAYYAVSLSGNTEATNITISATSGKRFVLFGVNQEGGVLPVLKSIEISGDLTNKSGYKVGDDLDLDGLTVSAIYTLNEVDQAPIDVTSLVNWSYDPLVEGQTSVTITATLEDKSDDITISDLEAVASADPKIYVSTLNVDFGSVEVGEAVPANKTITVTLTNVAAATATLGGTNPEAFSIDKTALVDGDVITISVIASTAAAASYSATITITDDAAAATEKVVNLSFAVTEPAVEETPVSTTSKWVPATEITDGMQVLIVGVNNSDYFAMGAQANNGTGNNRLAVPASVDEGVLTPGENTMAFTVVEQPDGSYALQTSNDKYLYAASSSNNYLKTKDELDDNGKWTLSVTSAVANGTYTHKMMQFNSSSSIFACYTTSTTTQKPIALYVEQTTPPTPATPDYTRDVTNGHYGTICLPKAGTIEGATLYEIGSFESNMIYVDEVGTTLAAGVPYIFYASEAQLNVYYTDKTADDVSAGNANGLYGFYNLNDEGATFNIPEDAGNYILYNDQYWLVSGRAAYIANYRAYIKLGSIVPKSAAPGRRRVAMAVNGTQTTTDCELINAAETPAKMLINGQLFILRGEKMYNVNGQIVK